MEILNRNFEVWTVVYWKWILPLIIHLSCSVFDFNVYKLSKITSISLQCLVSSSPCVLIALIVGWILNFLNAKWLINYLFQNVKWMNICWTGLSRQKLIVHTLFHSHCNDSFISSLFHSMRIGFWVEIWFSTKLIFKNIFYIATQNFRLTLKIKINPSSSRFLVVSRITC